MYDFATSLAVESPTNFQFFTPAGKQQLTVSGTVCLKLVMIMLQRKYLKKATRLHSTILRYQIVIQKYMPLADRTE